MPKINVYLPEDLAASVRRAGFPVSPVCQQALAEAVRSVTRARKVIDAIRSRAVNSDRLAEVGRAVERGITNRLATVLELAGRNAATAGNQVATGQLLLGLLDEGRNFAVSLLQLLDVDLDELRSSAESARSERPEAGEPGEPVRARPADEADDGSLSWNLSWPAWNAMAAALEAAIGFGHNYIGCEHLLVGLLADPDSQAGGVLRDHGVDSADLRRALTSAVTGFAHGRQSAGSIAEQLDQIGDRLDGIEQRLAAIGA